MARAPLRLVLGTFVCFLLQVTMTSGGTCLYTIQEGDTASSLLSQASSLSTQTSLQISDLLLVSGASLGPDQVLPGVLVQIPDCRTNADTKCPAACSGRGYYHTDSTCRCQQGFTGPNCERNTTCYDASLTQDGVPAYWTWPCPESRTITQKFDGTFIKYYCGYHSALDISGASARGKPIVSAADGTVVHVGNLWGTGRGPNSIVIQHALQVWTTYGHGESATVAVGDCVQAGDVIGTIGNLGISSGPHLHFEVVDNRANNRSILFSETSGRSSVCDPGVNPFDPKKTSFRDPSNFVSPSAPDVKPYVRPSPVCGGRGTCGRNGVCECGDGWSGVGCHVAPSEKLGCKGYELKIERPNAWLQAGITETNQSWHQPEVNVTLEAWVRPTYNAKYIGIVGNVWDTLSTESGFGFQLAGDDKVFFLIALETSKGFGDYSLQASIPLNEWSHLAGTYDGKVARLYVNGYLNNTRENAGRIHYNPSNNFTVGVMLDDNDESYYQGMLDDIRLWKTVRTEDEIRAGMKSPPRVQSNLIAYWKLDSSFQDASGNGHDLTLMSDVQSVEFEPCFGPYCQVTESDCTIPPSTAPTPTPSTANPSSTATPAVSSSATPSSSPDDGSQIGGETGTEGENPKTDPPREESSPPYLAMTLIITGGVVILGLVTLGIWYRLRSQGKGPAEVTVEESLTGMRVPVKKGAGHDAQGSAPTASAGVPYIPKRPQEQEMETFQKL